MNNKKPTFKIAILVRMFPNIVQTYVLNHILCLKNAGIDTLIVAERDPKQHEIHPRVLENKLIDETLYINTEKNNLLKQIPSIPFFDYRYLLILIKILFSNIWAKYGIIYGLKTLIRLQVRSNHHFDIIHSHSLFSSYDYLFLKDFFSIPLTTTFHGLVPNNVTMLDPVKIKAALDSGDAFFVNTEFARDQLIGLGCQQHKIHIIPQGTNTADFPFKPRDISTDKPIIILSVGRLSIEKGFHIAINAVAGLIKKYPEIKYHIVGAGPEEENLVTLINSLGLQDTVTIFGAISTDKLLAHYSGAHMFILPSIDFRDGSHTETQGVVLQEAQSSGLPIIASCTGGIPEIIKNGETGLLFDEEDVGQLVTHIETFINDKELYQRLILQGRKDVEDNYSIDVICHKLMKVYSSLLSKADN